MEPTYSADGTLTTVKPTAGMGDPAPGTYPNANVCILAMKTGGDTYSLEIPINLTVEG